MVFVWVTVREHFFLCTILHQMVGLCTVIMLIYILPWARSLLVNHGDPDRHGRRPAGFLLTSFPLHIQLTSFQTLLLLITPFNPFLIENTPVGLLTVLITLLWHYCDVLMCFLFCVNSDLIQGDIRRSRGSETLENGCKHKQIAPSSFPDVLRNYYSAAHPALWISEWPLYSERVQRHSLWHLFSSSSLAAHYNSVVQIIKSQYNVIKIQGTIKGLKWAEGDLEDLDY